jgi:hypothetical protein
VADGAEFSIDLEVEGTSAVAGMAASLDDLSAKLKVAGGAATAASDAVKVGQAAYGQAEISANRAAIALEKIGNAADAQKVKLASLAAGNADGVVNVAAYQKAAEKMEQLTARQAEAAAKASSTAAAMNAAAASLDNLKGSAAAAADNETRLATALKTETAAAKASEAAAKAQAKTTATAATATATAASKVAKGTDDAGKAAGTGAINFRALSSGLGKLGGPLGSIGSQAAGAGGALQKLSKALGAAGPYVAAAVLAVALAAAFVVATLAITKFAIGQADAARTSALLSAGIAHSVAGGEVLDAQLDDLASKVPIARDELASMAKGLSDGGLRGKDLAASLQNAAVKAAQLKFGPDFQKELLSLDSQATRFKFNIASIFGGLKIEGFLQALSKLVGLFDANEASGKAIKVVFESMFQPAVDGLTALVPKAVTAFLQLEILALKAAIAIKPYVGILKDIGIGFVVLGGVVVAVIAIAIAVVLACVAAFGLLLALPFLIADAFKYLAAAIPAGLGAAMDWLEGKFNAVVDFLSGLSLGDIGRMLIQGLIDGIMGAGPGVLSAITGIAGGAVDAAKSALGIKSPSTVFAEIGEHTAAGMEKGVDAGAGGVQSSVEALVTPPDAAKGGAGATASGTGGGNIYYLTIIAGGDDPSSFVDSFREFLEGLGAQAGTAVPDAA